MRLHGLSPEKQVVAYDSGGGAFAAHLWWLLRWLGHERVRVLDGGWRAGVAAGGKVDTPAPATLVTEAQAIQSAGWSGKPVMQEETADQVLEDLRSEKPAFIVMNAGSPD